MISSHALETDSHNLLVEAIDAWHDLLNRRPRDLVPLDWAMTQNNLGGALAILGERETGTAKLEKAMVAFREALVVFESAKADHYVTVARNNLKRAERLLEERQYESG